jgi:hypothetical protein
VDISKKIALDCCKLQQSLGHESSRVPVLVGKTSSGKTYYVQHELSKQLDLPIVKILLQNEQPDEILGYPKFMGQDKLEFLKPAWWTDTPSIFFFDELDKAREELHASILTLLREGTLRGRSLPKGSVMICAMNETEYLSDPLKARSVFLPFVHEIRDVQHPSLNKVTEYLQEFILKPTLPSQIHNMETLHFLNNLTTVNPNLLEDKRQIRHLCEGLFPNNYVLPVVDIICGLEDIDYVNLMKDSTLLENFVKNINNVYDGHKHFVNLLKVCTNSDTAYMIAKIPEKFADSNIEDLTKFLELCHDAWLNDIPNIGNHVFDTEVVTSLSSKTYRIIKDVTNNVDDKLDNFWEETRPKAKETEHASF